MLWKIFEAIYLHGKSMFSSRYQLDSTKVCVQTPQFIEVEHGLLILELSRSKQQVTPVASTKTQNPSFWLVIGFTESEVLPRNWNNITLQTGQPDARSVWAKFFAVAISCCFYSFFSCLAWQAWQALRRPSTRLTPARPYRFLWEALWLICGILSVYGQAKGCKYRVALG